MAQRRPGRPKLPTDQRLDWRIIVNLNVAEFSAVESAARKEGVSSSTWVRQAIQRSIRRRKS